MIQGTRKDAELELSRRLNGLFSAVRQLPPQRENNEGTLALLGLAMVVAIIFSLPLRLWTTLLPISWLFPMLLWQSESSV
jgi:hypothetical protein